eukprot:TRINITY_DN22015_c0_g1_i1.p1 TRINITY_DN22015_c0_g1~~TRINITY_DN22015_c0_g1_i1.p1  ORF type:complete len:509 (-),score=62.35 TRINITY_DN22015_c0_g1_i1:6-1532(-)
MKGSPNMAPFICLLIVSLNVVISGGIENLQREDWAFDFAASTDDNGLAVLKEHYPRPSDQRTCQLFTPRQNLFMLPIQTNTTHDVEEVLRFDLGFSISETRKVQATVELIWVRVTLMQASFGFNQFKLVRAHQKINRIPGSVEINRKDLLAKHIQSMKKTFGNEEFDFHPESFLIPEDSDALLKESGENPEQKYIVKPIYGGQGRGIHLVKGSEIADLGLSDNFMVQRYIENPLLVDGYKHTLRLYVLITSVNPLRVYIHRKGIIKFAGVRFESSIDKHNTNNSDMHITHPPQEVELVDTETSRVNWNDGPYRWSLQEYFKYLGEQGINTDSLWNQIKDGITKMVISVEEAMYNATSSDNPDFSRNTFQLMGTDVELDANYKPWIIESNINPALKYFVPFEHQEKRNLVVDTFNMVEITDFDSKQFKNDIRQKLLRDFPNLVEDEQAVLTDFVYENITKGEYELLYPARDADKYFGYFSSRVDRRLDRFQLGLAKNKSYETNKQRNEL